MAVARPQPPACTAMALGCLRRRRGVELENAILDAANEELSAVGYAAFTVEGVAARARTGKASIYRRWPTKSELIIDALSECLPVEQDGDGRVAFTDDVTTADALQMIARHIAQVLNSPAGDAIRAIKSAAVSDPELARMVDERFTAPRREVLVALLQRGVARGEVRAGALTDSVIDLLPALLFYRVVIQQTPITDREIESIVDQVLLPLIAS
jgi:AcrR family transcriptional regulator